MKQIKLRADGYRVGDYIFIVARNIKRKEYEVWLKNEYIYAMEHITNLPQEVYKNEEIENWIYNNAPLWIEWYKNNIEPF